MPTHGGNDARGASVAVGDISSINQLARMSAALFDIAERDDRFKALQDMLRAFCVFDNFLVYRFSGSMTPELMGASIPEMRLSLEMADFVAGLFLLDPFVIAAERGVSGLVRLEDIMPEAFRESEYFRRHYCYTDVIDEMRYLVPIAGRRTVHVFVEREQSGLPFSIGERELLHALSPLVQSFIRSRCRWLDRSAARRTEDAAPGIDIGARIAAMAPGVLTRRECGIVELMLKGYSAKLIGRALGIEEGTVTNHKRNIYAKLSIHSMAQLFDLFLRSL